jgi:lipopolysaccharide cholinephosphotransferase
MKKMQIKYLSGEKIKACELKILLKIHEFCKNHNIRYYLSGGTLLGAIRHKGFIPWDDDIDICMPRPDYERFITLFSQDENYSIKSDSLKNWDAPFTKIIDLNTAIESIFNKEQGGLWVDIFPVDGLPADMDQVQRIYRLCNFYRRIYLISNAKLGEGKSNFHKYSKYILKPLSLLYGKKRCVKKIEEIAQKYPYEQCKYVGAITWGLYGEGERMLKSEFEKRVMVEFEGYKFPTFSCWDSYLHGLYGDYMQLPPVEKRQTHDMKVYVKE